MNSKNVNIIGGIGNLWGRQFHQQDRVYNVKGISPAVNAMANNGLFVRKVHKFTRKGNVVIGQMDNTQDHTFESANRVYAGYGCAPTVNTCGGGGLQPKVIKKVESL